MPCFFIQNDFCAPHNYNSLPIHICYLDGSTSTSVQRWTVRSSTITMSQYPYIVFLTCTVTKFFSYFVIIAITTFLTGYYTRARTHTLFNETIICNPIMWEI